MSGKPQVDPVHYDGLRYDTRERFASYWHQVDQVLRRSPRDVLEIGIGNGFLHQYLRSKGVAVRTLDFDARLVPDVVGSVLELPFTNASFELVCCFETLEHLPWETFAQAIRQLARVSKRWVLLSLPDITPYVRVDIERTNRKQIIRTLRDLPNRRPREHVFDGQHYWEIGAKGFPFERIVAEIERAGLVVEEELRVFELPYHRYLSCRLQNPR
jgi:SAM-dependent methyltransferase